MEKKVFIIIVSYNGEHWIEKNLQSLRQSIYPVSTIVIDNKSTDTTVSLVQKFTEVELIESEENLGFGKANNLGIRRAIQRGADYVFLLNQDTWIFPETMKALVDTAANNPEFGILSPLHFSADNTTLDANFERYYQRKTKTISENLIEVPFVNAAAWLIPKRVIKQVGLFEPLFSHYGEDRNYVDRVGYHQFKIGVVKRTKMVHDRVIQRHFKKDVIQSKFMMLSTVLNVNHSLIMGYLKAFRSVFGLPKYFSKFYGSSQILRLFFTLLFYFAGLKLRIITLYKKRSSYK
ncbi:glycosyltransferase family 2 protein [Gaetbulibacter aestuarii]|uniref:Glycosyltransferase family 2 protein n=1 Tax=Gaetbulibacter aestuarii TaxID=1502358 RepID=A0ABW7MWI2_9FLAO